MNYVDAVAVLARPDCAAAVGKEMHYSFVSRDMSEDRANNLAV
jgi:hypothetical protein